ncbi:MAG: long-chain fatty acid--CoA ligase [Candidatus Nanopelagicales bacterium]|jgi:long-chain acyl-CoA synthetase|nr:long-chain fatty acid--CoA ligase [Candidatus Nanopelagicales bacterium]
MRTVSVPAAIPLPITDTLGTIPARNAARAPDRPAYALREPGGWRTVTAAQFHDQVQAVARGLVARGIKPGDPVGVLAPTSYAWTVLDFALWAAGAFAVPIYDSSSAEQVDWIVADSGLVAVIAASERLATAAGQSRDGALPVWIIDEGLLDALAAEGRDVDPAELARRTAATRPEDPATIVYTSGTTGRPKGCVITHANLTFVVRTLVAGTGPVVTTPGARTVLFLPLAHVLGRGAHLFCAEGGMQVAHCPDPKQLVEDITTFHPTFLVGVPRIFEKIFNASQQKAHDAGRGRVFDRATHVAIAHARAQRAGRVPPWLRVQHAVFDRLVYAKLRAALGGHLAYAITGGASLGERLGHFYAGIGLTVMEGYGLTESTASGTFNRADAARIGTVGQPMPGTEVAIADDGEIWLRGPHVMAGYHHLPEATAEAIDADGWLRTGDRGQLDADGFLQITGRSKEIIVTAGGKNVAPAVLEDRIQAHRLVSHAVVVGEGRPFVGALITLDPEALQAWARSHGRPSGELSALAGDAALRAEVQAAVDDANAAVSRAESIRAWRLVDTEFTQESGHVTPSLKLKRSVITEDLADEIEAIYSGGRGAGPAGP